MNKRVISAAAAAMLLLAGCGGSDSTETSSEEESLPAPSVTTAATTTAVSEAAPAVVTTTAAEAYVPADPRFSGPISKPKSEESEAIRKAPAYDTEKAKSYIDKMPQIRARIQNVQDVAELTVFGDAAPTEEAFTTLETEINNLTSHGRKVSLIMVDLETGSGVAYRPLQKLCTQSAVKAVYAGSLLESVPNVLLDNGQFMRDAIVDSNNDAYMSLKSFYGSSSLVNWCHEVGVDAMMSYDAYPRNSSVRDMLLLWTKLYCVLNDGTDTSNFGAYYADTLGSETAKRLGGRVPVQTKAGWESGLDTDKEYDPYASVPASYTDGNPENDECATNDTGIVYTDRGPYLFAVYTDCQYGIFKDITLENRLTGIVDALYNLQKSFSE